MSDFIVPSLYNLSCYKAYEENLNLAQLPKRIAVDVLPCCRWNDEKKFHHSIMKTAIRLEHHKCIRKLLRKCWRSDFLSWLSQEGSLKTLLCFASQDNIVYGYSLLLANLIRNRRTEDFLIVFNFLGISCYHENTGKLLPRINRSVMSAAILMEEKELVQYLLTDLNFWMTQEGVRIAMQCEDISLARLVIDNVLKKDDVQRAARWLVHSLFDLIDGEISTRKIDITFRAKSSLPGSKNATKAFRYWNWIKVLLEDPKIGHEVSELYKRRSEQLAMLGKSFWDYRGLMKGVEFGNTQALYGASKGLNLEMLQYILPNVSIYYSHLVLKYIMESALTRKPSEIDSTNNFYVTSERKNRMCACLEYVIDAESTNPITYYSENEITQLYCTAACFPGTYAMELLLTSKDTYVTSLKGIADIMECAIKIGNLDAIEFIDRYMIWDRVDDIDLFLFKHDCCNLSVLMNNVRILKYFHSRGYFWDQMTCQASIPRHSLTCLKYLRENGCPWNCQRMLAQASQAQWYAGINFCLENNCKIESEYVESLLPKVDYTAVTRKPVKTPVFDLYAK